MENDEDLHKNLRRKGIFVHCHHQHIIGEIVWLEDAYPEALYRYEKSLTCEPVELPKADVIVIGPARNIKCTICGFKQKGKRWDMSEAAVKAMMLDPRKNKGK